jgi:ACS family tartrate transporter-like MFS transporter
MLTWGVIAAAMMFVRTPTQFYVLRFLLGAAEAGFFPGVVYYLMHWFPAAERGRAISRFYVALPLSSVVMGVVAGALLGLRGQLGLYGWQWLFLIEGLPAIVLSVLILFLLPDSPDCAKWLTDAERDWIARAIAADRERVGASGDPGALRALVDPRIWVLGLANVCILGCSYAFTLSAPAILKAATGLSDTNVGFLVAAVAAVSAAGMILAGWHSDLRRERHGHVIAFLLTMAIAYGAIGLTANPWIVVGAYALTVIASNANQTVFWLIPSDVLHGRSAAVGVAAIGSIGMVGSFVGPWAWGVSKDATGSYAAGLYAIFAAYLFATAMIVLFRRLRPAAPGEPLAEVSAS